MRSIDERPSATYVVSVQKKRPGERLEAWRQSQPGKRPGRCLSVRRVCALLDISPDTLRKIVLGTTRPSLSVACKIEEATGGEIRCSDWCEPGALVADPRATAGGAAGEQAARAPVRRGAA